MHRLEVVRRALWATVVLATATALPSSGSCQVRVQAGDSVRFALRGGSDQDGAVVSTGSDMLRVREQGVERPYPRSELRRIRVLRPTRGAGERAFWRGAIIGGAVGGGAGLAVALRNLPFREDGDPRTPSDDRFVLAMTAGGAMLGGLTTGIIAALLAPDQEWLSVRPAVQPAVGGVDLELRIPVGAGRH